MNDVLPIHRGYQCTCGINERNNQQRQFSVSAPHTDEEKKELGNRRQRKLPRELPRTERQAAYQEVVGVHLWFLTDHPCRYHPWIVITLGILAASPAPPGAGLDRFPAPSVFPTTRY